MGLANIGWSKRSHKEELAETLFHKHSVYVTFESRPCELSISRVANQKCSTLGGMGTKKGHGGEILGC